MTPRVNDNNKLVYEIQIDNKKVILPREKILHLVGPSDDGVIGYSRIALARKSIGLGMAMETFGSLYFGNGTHPGVVVSHPGKLSEQAHSNLKQSLVDEYSSLGNSHRLLLLEEGMKIDKVGIPPEDSQFLQSRQFQVPEIARWFNLPPHKLKDLTRSSFSNIESEQTSFYTDTLLPNLVEFEQAYNMQLLTESERSRSGRGSLYFKHVTEGILRADSAGRGALYRELWNIGAISINEIRSKEEMDPIEGGDEHFVPLNMVPLSQVGKEDQTLPNQVTKLEPSKRQK